MSVPHRRLRPERALFSVQGGHQPPEPLDHDGEPHRPSPPVFLLGWEGRPMMRGTIIRLVTSYGSLWGRIQPEDAERPIFFNEASLAEGSAFADLVEGDAVSFEEEPDRANGTHAVRVVLDTRRSGGDAAQATALGVLPG